MDHVPISTMFSCSQPQLRYVLSNRREVDSKQATSKDAPVT